jgi:Arc/MetJ family transcription regulator
MSLRVDADLVRRAQKALGVRTKTRVVEQSLVTVVELEKHRRLIRRFSGTGKLHDFRQS